MKKTVLSLALLAVTGTAHGEYFNGRLSGMSGAGFATGDYADGVILNPSLGASFEENDDFALVVNGGALGAADADLLDDAEAAVDFLDELRGITSVYDLTPDLADRTIEHLQNLEGKQANVGVGGDVVLAIPNNFLSINLVAKSRLHANVTAAIDENDYNMIENAISTRFTPDDLNSEILTRGAMATEVGVALSKSLSAGENSQLLLGVTPKAVTVETFVYSPAISQFDEDEFDAEEYTVESTNTNFDAGLTYVSGNMHYAFTVRDAMAREYETITGETMETQPRPTAAIGYQSRWVTLETALDLSARSDLVTDRDTRIARVGLELSPFSWIQFRAGMQSDMEKNIEDTYSVGFGLSPFGILNVDIAAVGGKSEETFGAMAQVGFRF